MKICIVDIQNSPKCMDFIYNNKAFGIGIIGGFVTFNKLDWGTEI